MWLYSCTIVHVVWRQIPIIYSFVCIIQGRIYYEANEASASAPHHLGGPHQNFNAVSKVNFFIA